MSTDNETNPAAAPDALTQYRLTMIEKTLQAISENLTKLASLEQKHIETREAIERAFNALEKHDTRIKSIETEMPTLQLVRGWVITGVVGILGLVGMMAFKLMTQG